MDLKKALGLLNGEDNIYLNKYITSNDVDTSSTLKDFFVVINEDIMKWLRSIPNAKSINTFRKYKKCLISLLDNEEVKQELGKEYCGSIKTSINKAFHDNVNLIAKERKNVVELEESVCGTEMDINDIEVQCDDYRKRYVDLREEYKLLQLEYKITKDRMMNEIEFLREVVRNMARNY
jgi:hypothetical protein